MAKRLGKMKIDGAVEKSFCKDARRTRNAGGRVISMIWPMNCAYSDHVAQMTKAGKYAQKKEKSNEAS